jgi:uncharacterized protein
MEASPSPDRGLTEREGALLLDIADTAIREGLHGLLQTKPDLDALPAVLRSPSGAFVTLHVGGELNGCIGSVAGREPLAFETARHARSAAFADPRLPALRPADYAGLHIEVSVLTPLTPIEAATRAELVGRLRPGVDGVLLVAAGRQAVFLPKVWEQLRDPEDFLDHLLRKAGLPPTWWPPDTTALRFTTDSFGRPTGPGRSRSTSPPGPVLGASVTQRG